MRHILLRGRLGMGERRAGRGPMFLWQAGRGTRRGQQHPARRQAVCRRSRGGKRSRARLETTPTVPDLLSAAACNRQGMSEPLTRCSGRWRATSRQKAYRPAVPGMGMGMGSFLHRPLPPQPYSTSSSSSSSNRRVCLVTELGSLHNQHPRHLMEFVEPR
ncbi:hypothetical protein M406DRAFT_357105 [Cryphonectria parasitica EP155]|uniref:Uncharacterized protein n=1 Tax=Cryphonectria parasitica (strain ATCC 38755 / EP155) TaxID=660469 RepID=A0A9P5CLM9_CRYP1|nr:uncharacterized protein M406DRAFT_357105 [Cryphonectria parasitica EP155]KAF3763504.1 hypothetical protein M406DRAFT_357105 [Cryphonectria parasitica EP155]